MDIREETGSMVPPNSVEAEISVLGAMLQDSTAVLRAAEQLKSDDFYQPEHRELFQVMADMNRQQMPIDLVTVQGTNVYAVFKGVVSRTFTCPNGTLGVIIRHGDYMTVYCNLASLSVKSGQQVATRAVIGTVANDGNGHGEFSFQLWKGRESQNPRSWLR